MIILYENPADFHDITSGTSTGNPQYSAGPGYVTGIGTPNANPVVGSLVGATTAVFVKQDTTTQGNGIEAYGTEGYDVIDNAASLPSCATVTSSGENNYV